MPDSYHIPSQISIKHHASSTHRTDSSDKHNGLADKKDICFLDGVRHFSLYSEAYRTGRIADEPT